MSFTVPHFYLLVLFTFSLYWLIPSQKFRRRFLLLGSFLFYAFWNYRFFSLLLISAGSDYVAALMISRTPNLRARKALLGATMSVNFGLLAYFKYANFFLQLASHVVPGFNFTVDVVLPLGISFYTFHTVSYTVDVYRGEVEPITNFWDYFLFVGYFPQLVAGPIARVTKLYPQFFVKQSPELRRIADGILMMGFGLFLKFLVADELGGVAEYFFNAQAPNATVAWTAVFSFGYQIYVDFWSYTMIARGVSRLFGIELNLNFAQPYLSATPAEFWRRWHISLSTWFRDYLYIPLGGNRRHELRNLLITMTVAGFWHGGSVLFLLWGFYHGVLLVAFKRVRLPNWVSAPLTFLLVQVGWILFRSQNFSQAARIFLALGRFVPNPDPAIVAPVRLTLFLVGLVACIDVGFRAWERIPEATAESVSYAKLSLASVFVLAAIYLGESGATPFIYFNF